MKKTAIALVLCSFAVAGCSQTTQEQTSATAMQAQTPRAGASAGRCDDAVRKAAQSGQNAAMAGTALSMASAFGGYAGRGGAVVGQVASLGGSLVQAQARNQATANVMENCR